MILNYIYGNSGSGKSTYMCKTITELARKNQEKKYIVIVPEQYTLHTQRQYVFGSENDVIVNVDVLSFNRLAFRILEELGLSNIKTMDDLGKSLILRRLTSEYKSQFGALKGNIMRPGYIDEIKSLITELVQYNVSPAQLLELTEAKQASGLLKSKLHDVELIYGEFLNRIHEKGVMGEELLQFVAERMSESHLLDGATLVFDCFTGFTPMQMIFLREAFKAIDEAYVCLTLDDRESYTDIVSSNSNDFSNLFYLTKKCTRALNELVLEVGGSINEPLRLNNGRDNRFKASDELLHLEQNLFRDDVKKRPGETRDIKVIQAPGITSEIEYVASEIKRLVREEGLRYRDIAVVSGDVETYSHYAPSIFSRYEIPIFLDMKVKVLYEPMSELIKSLIDVARENYSYDSVMRVLKTGLFDIDEDMLDEFDNYVLAYGIDGRRKANYSQKFAKYPSKMKPEIMDEIEKIRLIVWNTLSPLVHELKLQNTIADKNKALRNCFDSIVGQIPEKEGILPGHKLERRKVYDLIMDTLETVDNVTGEDVINLDDYADLLETALGSLEMTFIPTFFDRVTVGDIERTRLEDIKVLFFMGVNDGIIPASSDNGGILSELDRETILNLGNSNETDIELAPTGKQRAFIQRFYLYLNMTKPSHKLYITRFGVGADGKSVNASYLISFIGRMFEGLTTESIKQGAGFYDINQIATVENGLTLLSENVRELINSDEDKRTTALLQWFLDKEEYKDAIGNILNGVFISYKPDMLPDVVTKLLYGESIKLSVSKIGEFNSCPYKYFLRYGIGLKERDLFDFNKQDFGNLLHSSLEHYTQKLISENKRWQDLDEAQIEAYCNEAMDEALLGERNDALFDGKRNEYLKKRIKSSLDFCIGILTDQAKRGKFVPVGSEVSFASEPGSALAGTTSNGRTYSVQGKIDRVDGAELDNKKFISITDYKTGSSVSFDLDKMYNGLSVQLPVYLKAALENEKLSGGMPMAPAGMFLYHAMDVTTEDEKGEKTDEEIRNDEMGQLRLVGLYSSDEDVINLYGPMEGSKGSLVIHCKYNKDGGLDSHSVNSAFSEEEINNGLDFVTDKVRQSAEGISTGDIEIRPYNRDDSHPCDYCEFKCVCGFDEKIPGFRYRKIDKKSDKEEMIRIMRGECD